MILFNSEFDNEYESLYNGNCETLIEIIMW